jgi:hypothetical protein
MLRRVLSQATVNGELQKPCQDQRCRQNKPLGSIADAARRAEKAAAGKSARQNFPGGKAQASIC